MSEKSNKLNTQETVATIVGLSIIAVTFFYFISPKYWLALTIASPIPPIP